MPTRKLILHIEDNFDNRLLVRRLLHSASYNVIEAENARQAINALCKYCPDLILMDINIPGVDGYTLTAKLKSIPSVKNIPIVAITANAMRGDREKSFLAGCDGYVEKPIDIDNFLDKVSDFISGNGKSGDLYG
ncbi:MAG: response regulator [Anaerolineaceae bacterium]|jgi:two-component system cell cycle response regulator DivK